MALQVQSHPQQNIHPAFKVVLQSSVFMVGQHVGMSALSGFIAAALGYTGVFLIGFVVCLASVWLATQMAGRADLILCPTLNIQLR